MMKLRFAEPSHLIDINRIGELKGIREDGGVIRIGAMSTEAELIASPLINAKVPLLAKRHARSPTRRCATAAPSAATRAWRSRQRPAGGIDRPGRELRVARAEGRAQRRRRRLLPRHLMTQMATDEILKEIVVPVPRAGSGHAYCKLKRKTGDYATARPRSSSRWPAAYAARPRLRSPTSARLR